MQAMASWSSTCSIRMGRHISGILGKKTSITLFRDPLALNIYHLLPTTDLRTTNSYKHCVKLLDKMVDDQLSVLYPLKREDFSAELWQTTAKLLVLFDGSEPVHHNNLTYGFEREFSSVCKFLADGGKVLLFLNSSIGAGNTLSPTSFGHFFVASEVAIPSTECAQWNWTTHEPAPLIPNLRILVGSFETSSRASLVIACIDSLETHPEVLKQGLELLDVPCRPVLNNVLETPANITLFYSMSVNADDTQTAETLKLFSAPSTLAGLGGCPRAELRHCSNMSSLPLGFDWLAYRSSLATRTLGKTLIWTESLGSSWLLCESLFSKIPPHSGLVVVSNRQTQGKGRGDNRWVTLPGQAAFTFALTLTAPTYVAPHSKVAFANYITGMQHLVALSILLAAKQLIAERLGLPDGYRDASELDEEFLVNLQHPGPQIRLKWPNDVHVVECNHKGDGAPSHPERPHSGKLAGMLTRCSLTDDKQANFIIGTGINVSNRLPTICLQDLLNQVDSKQPSVLPTAKVIATVLSRLERLVDRTLHTSGLSWAFDLYTRCWMHTNQTVEVRSVERGSPIVHHKCTVTGLDTFGYLLVRDNETGEQFSLHPDGNSMDMMLGLIKPK